MNPLFFNLDFRKLLATRFFTSMALQIQAVVVGWEVYRLTRDPLLLGLLGLTEAVPAIACSLISGSVVDANKPVRIYRISVFALFLNSLLLFIGGFPQINIDAKIRLILLFTGVAVSGAVRSFAPPSVFSIIPQIVESKLISAAQALSSSVFQVAAIVGPALGGLIYQSAGVLAAFSLSPILLFAGFLSTWRFSKALGQYKSHGSSKNLWTGLTSGLHFVFKQKVLLSTMLLDMFSVLLGGVTAVLPIFADQVFGGGAQSLGYLRAASSVGSGIIALILAIRPLKVISGRTLLISVAAFGAFTLAFALTSNFYLALFFLAMTGFFDGISMVIRATILQLQTPAHMRGRVAAISSIFITSSNEIGAFESGLAARLLGLIPSVIFGSLSTLGVVAVVSVNSPELAKTRIRPDIDERILAEQESAEVSQEDF